ncbi:hypothetical protein D3C78_1834610 [compost metagenome]
MGYESYIIKMDNMNRVYVGPIHGRAEAEKIRSEINGKFRLPGIVIYYDEKTRATKNN